MSDQLLIDEKVTIDQQPDATWNTLEGGEKYSKRPAPGTWGSEVWDCFDNIFPSCWCASIPVTNLWLHAQMVAKENLYEFWKVILVGSLVALISLLIDIVAMALGAYHTTIMFYISSFLFFFAINGTLRLHLVKKHNIHSCANPEAECCWSFWCTPCSACQIARFLYGYQHVFDGDANPHRKDLYEPGSAEEQQHMV